MPMMTIMTPKAPSGGGTKTAPTRSGGSSQIFPQRSPAGPTIPNYTPGPTAGNMRQAYSGGLHPWSGANLINQEQQKPINQLINQFGQGTQAQIDANTGEYLNQVGLAGELTNLTGDVAEQQAGFDSARLGEQKYRNVDLEREKLLQDQANRDTQFGFVREKYNSQLGEVDRQLADLEKQYQADAAFGHDVLGTDIENRAGIANEKYQNDRKYLEWQKGNLTTLQGFIDQAYSIGMGAAGSERDLGMRAADMQRRRGERAAKSSAVTRGALLSSGYATDRQEIAEDYGLATDTLASQYDTRSKELGLSRDQGTNEVVGKGKGLEHSLTGVDIGYKDSQRGFQVERDTLSKDLKDRERGFNENLAKGWHEKDLLGIDFRSNQASNEASKRDTDILNRSLDSLGREYGIRQEETQAALKNAVRKANLDYTSTVNQLSSALGSSNKKAQQEALNFMSQLLTMGAR